MFFFNMADLVYTQSQPFKGRATYYCPKHKFYNPDKGCTLITSDAIGGKSNPKSTTPKGVALK